MACFSVYWQAHHEGNLQVDQHKGKMGLMADGRSSSGLQTDLKSKLPSCRSAYESNIADEGKITYEVKNAKKALI